MSLFRSILYLSIGPLVGISFYLVSTLGVGSLIVISVLPIICLVLLTPYPTQSIDRMLFGIVAIAIASSAISVLFWQEARIYKISVLFYSSVCFGALYVVAKTVTRRTFWAFVFGLWIYGLIVLLPILRSGSLTVGGHYQSFDEEGAMSAWHASTLDPALIVGTLAVIFVCWSIGCIRERSFHWQWVCGTAIAILLIVELFILNRRTVLGALVLCICITYLPKRIVFFLVPIILLPFWWEIASTFLIQVFNIDTLRNLVHRSDEADLISGNSRELVWQYTLTALGSPTFGFEWLTGDRQIFDSIPEKQLSHAHNTLLQSYVERGVVGLIAMAIYMSVILWRLGKITKNYCIEYECVRSVMIFLLLVGGMESVTKVPSLGFVLFISFSGMLFANWTVKIKVDSIDSGKDSALKVSSA